MITADRLVDGRAAVIDAVAGHPYARHTVPPGEEPPGYGLGDGVLWLVPTANGPAGYALGSAGPVLDLAAGLVADGLIGSGGWLHLPRMSRRRLTRRLPVARHDEWDFHWTASAPPVQPGEEQVVGLTDADAAALTDLIEAAFPHTTSRPGDPRVRGWYGIRSGGRLVACGADRSQGDIGFLAGVAVAPGLRGQGLGGAVTAALTRRLLARYDRVALGVFSANTGASRLYRRLGFVEAVARSSVRLG